MKPCFIKQKPKISKQNKQAEQIRKALGNSGIFFGCSSSYFGPKTRKTQGSRLIPLALLRYLLLEQHVTDNLSIVFAE